MPAQEQYPSSQNEQNLLRAENSHVNGKPSQTEYIDAQINQGLEPHAVVPTLNEGAQVCNSKYEC